MIKEKLIHLHKEHCNSVEQKMLYNIAVLLTELYEALKPEQVEEIEKLDEKKFKCTQCGEGFDNKGSLLAHCKKHKKKVKNRKEGA